MPDWAPPRRGYASESKIIGPTQEQREDQGRERKTGDGRGESEPDREATEVQE
jgi:hypothetical protein